MHIGQSQYAPRNSCVLQPGRVKWKIYAIGNTTYFITPERLAFMTPEKVATEQTHQRISHALKKSERLDNTWKKIGVWKRPKRLDPDLHFMQFVRFS